MEKASVAPEEKIAYQKLTDFVKRINLNSGEDQGDEL